MIMVTYYVMIKTTFCDLYYGAISL